MTGVVAVAARCALAVAVTTVAVQLWGVALRDEAPLPVPVFTLPEADAAVATATLGARRAGPSVAPGVVVRSGLVAAARPSDGGRSTPPASSPATTGPGSVLPPAPRPDRSGVQPDLVPPPRPSSPRPTEGPPASAPETAPAPSPTAPESPPPPQQPRHPLPPSASEQPVAEQQVADEGREPGQSDVDHGHAAP